MATKTIKTGGTTFTDDGLKFSVDTRLSYKKGTDVASASSITLASNGNVFTITGTTTITNISVTGWQDGSMIFLRISNAAGLTITNSAGGSGQIINPSANIVAVQYDVYQFMLDGTSWYRVK